MKKLIIISIAALFCLHSNAQNVGIGIATPKAMLHIKGNADTSQLVIDANVTQSNTRPLIRLRKADGTDLLHIHSDNINNTFVGLNAGRVNNAVSGGGYNSFFGSNAGYSNTVGGYNTAIGQAALYLNTGGQFNTAQGYQALYTNISDANTANGYQVLYSNSLGSANTSSGAVSLFHNSNGSNNTATGAQALYNNTTASNNVAIGYNALFSQSFSNGGIAWNSNNVAVGNEALYLNNPNATNKGINNTAIGTGALYGNTTGVANTAIGQFALYNNQDGYNNTAIGKDALINTSGNQNTGLGYQALFNNSMGVGNTAVGEFALYNNVSGAFNIAIGYNSGTYTTFPNINNSIGIGNQDIQIGTNNQVVIGNFSTGSYLSHVSWATFSDARIKTDIKEEVKGLDFIIRLKPVTYYKSIKAMVAVTGSKETKDFPGKYDVEKIKFSGFLAQEVEKAADESGYDFSGIHKPNNSRELYALSYETFVVPLVKAVQEQQVMIVKQNKLIEDLLKRVTALEKK